MKLLTRLSSSLLFIFVTACNSNECMTLSQSLPWVFFRTGTPTFNESRIYGTNHKCFCRKVQCTDETTFQMYAEDGIDGVYNLAIRNSQSGATLHSYGLPSTFVDDVYVYQHAFTLQNQGICGLNGFGEVRLMHIMPAPASFENYIGLLQPSWTLAGPEVNLNAIPGQSASKIHKYWRSVPSGNRNFDINVTVSGVSGGATVVFLLQFLREGVVVGSHTTAALGAGTHSFLGVAINNTQVPDEVVFHASIPGPSGALTFRVNDVDLVPVANDFDVIYTSEELNIALTHDGTELLEYTNDRDFNGLKYGGIVPPTFKARVPARFNEETTVEQNERETQTDGAVQPVMTTVKDQVLLEFDLIPDYLHKSIQGILQHIKNGSVVSNGVRYTKEGAYTKKPRRKDNRRSRAEVLLTVQGSLERNVY
jgi:hypothetical protein